MEEEGGFGVYGEKTRYATLQQKQKIENVPNNRGYETLRHFRNNIPSLVSLSCKLTTKGWSNLRAKAFYYWRIL